jgi:hypothetical protein
VPALRPAAEAARSPAGPLGSPAACAPWGRGAPLVGKACGRSDGAGGPPASGQLWRLDHDVCAPAAGAASGCCGAAECPLLGQLHGRWVGGPRRPAVPCPTSPHPTLPHPTPCMFPPAPACPTSAACGSLADRCVHAACRAPCRELPLAVPAAKQPAAALAAAGGGRQRAAAAAGTRCVAAGRLPCCVPDMGCGFWRRACRCHDCWPLLAHWVRPVASAPLQGPWGGR